jgi:RNA polymerase sigma-70 factor (ECF subfamily)
VPPQNVSTPVSEASGEPSSSLLVRVRAQDPRAWERLVCLYAPLVYRWCRDSGLQAADAADVGQDVFGAVARTVGDFRREGPGDSFRAWLRTVTRHKVVDLLRQRQGSAAAEGGSGPLSLLHGVAASSATGPAVENGEAEETRLLYRRAMDLIRTDFQEPTWRAFVRVVVDGVSPAEVAAELGLSPNAVYLAKARVLRRLREEFADLEEL